MAADDANEPEHPFTNPLFANIAKAMAAQGPLQWDVAQGAGPLTYTVLRARSGQAVSQLASGLSQNRFTDLTASFQHHVLRHQ
ncbi:MAG: hypothetical protein EBX38_03925 [Actinobacteria bacterium]|nr:hypothetical protein [Actinomycetota bacterium]